MKATHKRKRRKRPLTDAERAFVEGWKKAGPALERIRIQELRSAEYGKNWRLLDGLLEIATLRGGVRTSSGMVEMQRIFAKARR